MVMKLLIKSQKSQKSYHKIIQRQLTNLCDYSDAYILVKGIKSMGNTAAANNENKEVTLKNCAPFTDCISQL